MSDENRSSNVAEFTVSEISYAVKASIEDQFGYVRVRGELGRVSRPASGHIYLDLKDEKSVLSGVVWRGVAGRLKVKPEQGLEVVATGKLTTFPGQSKYQMVIDHMEPAGAGALMALLEERKKKLAAEGLFAAERKKPLPHLPRVIGVVTSPTGAVIRDILHRVQDRFPVHVLVWPVRVQGESCAAEVAAAIDGFNALPEGGAMPRPDLLIVARGGGSLEDLWGFNEEAPARAVARSAIPVISAVGHETDVTLIDYVADLRAPTPTGAAEMTLPVRSELLGTLGDLHLRHFGAMARMMDRRRADLRSAARALPQPETILAMARQRFDMAAGRLQQGLVRATMDRRGRFNMVAGRLRPGLVSGQITQQSERLSARGERLVRSLSGATGNHRGRFEALSMRLRPGLVADRLSLAAERADDRVIRLNRAFGQGIEQRRQALNASGRLLESLSHKGVLARGFALVRDRAGQPIRRAAMVSPGQTMQIQFADGGIRAAANLLDPNVPDEESGEGEPGSGITPPSAPSTSGIKEAAAGLASGIMGSDAISAEDIEANLRRLAGKRGRKRSAPAAAPTMTETSDDNAASLARSKAGDQPPASSEEVASDAQLEVQSDTQSDMQADAPSDNPAERLEQATAKLTDAIEQEILQKAKALAKPRPRKKPKPDDDAQGSLF